MSENRDLAEARAHGFEFEPADNSSDPKFRVTLRRSLVFHLGELPRLDSLAFARGVCVGLARLRAISERPE